MPCCRKALRKQPFLQQRTKRPSFSGTRKTKEQATIDNRGETSFLSRPSLLCKYLEDKGGDLVVSVTKEKKLLFTSSGSSFDLEENLDLYQCSGKTRMIVKAIRQKLDSLQEPPTTSDIKLNTLLALLIDMRKKES